MSVTAKILGGAGCCPCPDVVGCACETDCALECRGKVGTAELCGFEEWEPTLPPKKYRRKSSTTDAPFVVRDELPDCASDAACPIAYADTWGPDYYPGFPWLMYSYSTLTPISQTDTTVTYTCTAYGYYPYGPDPPLENVAGAVRIEEIGAPVPQTIPNGGEVTLPKGTQWNCVGLLYIGAFVVVMGDAQCMSIGYYRAGWCDTWNDWTQYAASDCVITQSEAALTFRRETSCPGVLCPCENAGSPGPINCASGPSTCYGAGATATVVGPTLRNTEGVGCIDLGGGAWRQYVGVVEETLSDEDTEADAIAREVGAYEWGGVPVCLAAPAFITSRGEGVFTFEFRIMQVRVRLIGLAAGTYRVTIRYFRRVRGSSDPYAAFAIEVIDLGVDADPDQDDYTPWVDVPNERGYETRPQVCEVELLT